MSLNTMTDDEFAWEEAGYLYGRHNLITQTVMRKCREISLSGRELRVGHKVATYLDGTMWTLAAREGWPASPIDAPLILPQIGDKVIFHHAATEVWGVVVLLPRSAALVESGVNGWPKFEPGIVLWELWEMFSECCPAA